MKTLYCAIHTPTTGLRFCFCSLCPLWGTTISAQVLKPYLVRDIDDRTIETPHTLHGFSIDGEDFYFLSSGVQPGLWHMNASRPLPHMVDTVSLGGSPLYTGNGLAMYLRADVGSTQAVMAITNGTTPATHALDQSVANSFLFKSAAACGSKLCFSVGGNHIGVTDGTVEGTSIIASTEPNETASNLPLEVTSANGRAFFRAFDFAHGQCYVSRDFGSFCGELWSSDGTAAGTKLVSDILSGPIGSSPRFLFPWRDKLLFTAFRPDYRAANFYVTDGTPAGTQLLTHDSYVFLQLFVFILTAKQSYPRLATCVTSAARPSDS